MHASFVDSDYNKFGLLHYLFKAFMYSESPPPQKKRKKEKLMMVKKKTKTTITKGGRTHQEGHKATLSSLQN